MKTGMYVAALALALAVLFAPAGNNALAAGRAGG